MSEADGMAGKGTEQTGEHIDHERREALTRFAKYTAPVLLAALISVAESRPLVAQSGPGPVE